MHHRLSKLHEVLTSEKQTAFLVSTPTNIHYLSGFAPGFASPNREALLLITSKKALLFHSPLAKPKTLSAITSVPFSKPFSRELKKTLAGEKVKSLLFEPQDLTIAEYMRLKKIMSLIPKTNLIETLRQEKDKEEIALITKACTVAKKTISFLKKHLNPGKTEKELAWIAEKYLKENGADSLAFPVIVASGQSSAIPHHSPSDRKLEKIDSVLIDLGCKVGGYCSDITRTFFIGSPTDEQKQVEAIVRQAHQAALKSLKQHSGSGARRLSRSGKSVDQAARQVITKAKLGKYFTHGTGHSLGLDIHETPSISPHSKDILKENMVITLEPGVYIPGKFGYRHEDTILITESGYKNLTHP